MSEPSALVYARHFNLTQDHTDIDILRNLNHLHSSTQQAATNCSVDDDCSQLLQTFERAAHQYLTLASDEPLHISRDVTTFLQNCTSKSAPNLHEIYQSLLPDPYRMQKLKLKVPLLVISGGDVHKDVRRIRKGINLGRVLDHLLEDYEETSRHRNRDGELSSTLAAEMREMAQRELEKATQREVIEVSEKCLRFLKDVFDCSVGEDYMAAIKNESLPPIERPTPPTAINICEHDFELESDEDQDQNPIELPLTTPEEVESNSSIVKREGNDLLSCLDSAVEYEINQTDTPIQADEEINDLLKQFTNHDFEGLEEKGVDETVNGGEGLDAARPRKRPKLIHERDEESGSTETPSLLSTGERSALSRSYWQAQKIAVSKVESEPTRLPFLDLDNVLAFPERTKGQPVVTAETKEPLPLAVPSMEEVMSAAMPGNIAVLEKYLGKPKPIVTSDKLLFKEPSLRILEKADCDEEELVVEDYYLDESKANTFVSTSLKVKNEPRISPSNTDDSEVKAEPSEHVGISIQKTPSVEETGEQPTVIKTRSQSPLVQTPLPLPQRLGNQFDRSAIDTKQDAKHIGQHFGTTSEPQSASRENDRAHVKAEWTAKPQETVARLLSRSRKSKTKLPKPQGEDHRPSPFASDSLSGFLDLRGKKFKAPPVQQTCNKSEIPDDPIQSTQNSIPEQDGTTGNPSLSPEATNSLKAGPDVFPPVTAFDQPKTLTLSNNILRTKPLLAQFLERTGAEKLNLIYRDLDQQQDRGPDMILNPSTCLVITNLQALSQRPLPGQKTPTGLSYVHDQVAMLTLRYKTVMVLVHYLVMAEAGLQQRQSSSMACFASFCHQLTATRDGQASNALPMWVPCSKASSTSATVNAWVGRIIQQHAYDTPSPHEAKSAIQSSAALIQDETDWELFLVRAGLNPMAAQVMIGSLKRPGMASGTMTGRDPGWGLRRLVSMEAIERHNMFDKLIGKDAVDRLEHVLRGH